MGATDAVRESRSIIFYAWTGLAVQSVLTAGVIVFVLAGAAYQRSAIDQLRGRIQAIQVVGLVTEADFLDAQRAITGYQATGAAGLLTGYQAERREFESQTRQLHRLAWPALSGSILAEERSAQAAFRTDDQAVAAARGSAAAARFYRSAASIRIREHLRADAIIREAVTAIHEHLPVDFVWVGIVTGERLTLADGDSGGRKGATDPIGHLPPGSIDWIWDIYRHRSSYRVQDLDAAQAEEIPAEIRKILLSQGATALLLTPFGAGQELLGCLTLLRAGAGQAWTQPEIEAVESLAGDIGRGLEHARLYEGEERLVAELESLSEAKASFLASASHDLRTPLTSIIGYVELLADEEAGPIRPAQAKMLDGVDRNARRLKTMIEDMLTISKIELGAFTSRLEPLDLGALLPSAADVIRPSAGARGLSFEVSCPDQPVMIDGDPEQLDRLLVNLLSNAVKYTPRGGNVALALDSADDSAVLSVADTGIGIPEEDQDALFTRFFRASNAVEAAIPGSGLGLSIVRTIVANHHGELSIRSGRDQGTTVTVRIPLDNGAAPALAR